MQFSDYLSERDRLDDGHASGNGPYPMRGDMTSEEYIIKLLQTIDSLNRTISDLRGMISGLKAEISSLRNQMERLEEDKAEDAGERKRLLRLIEAKDDDNRRLTEQIAELLAKVDGLGAQLQDKLHQLSHRNRDLFGDKTNRSNARKNTPGRDDDHDDYPASSDTRTETEDKDRKDGPPAQSEITETKPLDIPKSDFTEPIDLKDFEEKVSRDRPDGYESAHADRVVKFDCDRSQVKGVIKSETVRSVFNHVSYVEERQYVFITSEYEEPVYDPETGETIDFIIRQETRHYPMKEDIAEEGAAQETVEFMDRLPGMIDGHFMTAEMIAEIVFQYLVCFTPINRQSKAFKEQGLKINRQTVTEIYHSIGYLLEPVYEALKRKVMANNAFLNCDETWFRLHFKDETKKGYIWIMANREEDSMFYFYDEGSRARKVLQEMIEGTEIKAVMSDGYVAYKHLDLEDSDIEHLADLAHIRTKFMRWIEVAPDEDAADMIRDFNLLFRLERYYGRKNLTVKEIENARINDDSIVILQRIANRLTTLENRLKDDNDKIPKVGQRAVNYMKSLWAAVLKWCRDGRYSLDNNLAERCARPVALMRKNVMHFASHKGANVFSIFGSLIQSCLMCGQSVKQYLIRVIKEINGGNKDYDSLIPGVITL